MTEKPDVDTGVSVWVGVGVFLAAVALLAYPLWWVLDFYVFNETAEPALESIAESTQTSQAAAIPVNIALGKSVSGTGPGSDPAGRIVDGSLDVGWNAGNYAPQVVEIDLGEPSTIHSIRLLIGQYPNGNTRHVIFGLGPGASEPEVLHVFEGFTTDGQWLTYTPETPWEGVDRIGVGTVASPSWVAWFEIQVLGTVP